MKACILLAVWVIMTPVTAQTNIEKTIGFQGKTSVKMDIQIADSIVISTWNRQEVGVKALVNLNDNKDNEAYVTSFDTQGDQVVITAKIKEEYFKKHNNCCDESMITWKVLIPQNAPFSVETINGNIVITGSTTEIKAKTISGFIDWAVANGRKADLKMSTISGMLYSNLDLKFSGNNNQIPQSVNQSLNGGGYPVKLETISGDIYCRKQ
jgi:hypothetical protein